MDPDRTPELGDHVRIRRTPETEAAGYAGLAGAVHGFTTPSVTEVPVIGGAADDYALDVYFEDRDEGAWFAPGLVEFVDHGAGTEITIGANPTKKFVRNAQGGWDELPIHPTPPGGWLQRLRRLFD